MAKYYLIASYYDMFEKDPNLKYKNETIVDGKSLNIDLSTLQAIDAFTASHTKIELFKILEQQLGITGKNHLAIKYQKNKNSKPDYYRVIENNKEFVKCTKNNKSIGYWGLGTFKKTLRIATEPVLFQKELKVLLSLLEDKNIEEIKQKFPYENSMLISLIEQYINSPHDNERDEKEFLDIIKKEFSGYKTFRGWIIAKEKMTGYNYSKKNTEKKKQEKSKLDKPIIVHSIEEHEKDYEQQFIKNNGINYYSYKAKQYNTAYLDEDKEEFLDEQELSSIYNEEKVESTSHTKKRSRT